MSSDFSPEQAAGPSDSSTSPWAERIVRPGLKKRAYFTKQDMKGEEADAAVDWFLQNGDCSKLEALIVTSPDMTDRAIPGLLEIIRRSPHMEAIVWHEGNTMTADGKRRFLEGIRADGRINELNCSQTSLPGCGDVLASILDNNPVQFLLLQQSQLNDADIIALAPAVARSQTLEKLNINYNHLRPAGAEAVVNAAFGRSRSLYTLEMLDDHPAVEALISRAVIAHQPPHIIALAPSCEAEQAKHIVQVNLDAATSSRNMAASSVRAIVDDEAEPRAVHKIFQVEARFVACKSLSDSAKVGMYTKMYDRLPPLPPLGGDGKQDVESLFASRRDHCSVAPLDNPRLFGSGEEARAFLGSLPWSPELLSRRTEQGSGVLDAALLRLPLKEVVREVNLKGLSIDRAALQEGDGQPSQLFRLVETTHQGMALFSQANLAGQATGDVMWMRGKLPDYQRPGFVARHMAGTDRDTGMARGR